MTDKDIISCQTFPQDYDFMGQNVQYVCGMSVPPVMMAVLPVRSNEGMPIFRFKWDNTTGWPREPARRSNIEL